MFEILMTPLVEFWCTRSSDSAPLIKSQNFYGTSSEHRFYSQKVKKIKIKRRPPVPDKHIIIKFLWPNPCYKNVKMYLTILNI